MSDDDEPQLSTETMAALLQFYQEQEERDEKLQQIAEGQIPDTFEENWNMSQFWYAADTANILADECLRLTSSLSGGSIACISSPTLYKALKAKDHNCTVRLFEYDKRFAVFKDDFVLYDFNDPLGIPRELSGTFDVVFADPPYLDENCLTKTSVTVRFVAKDAAAVIVCTGAVMESLAEKLLHLQRSKFQVKHERQLSNPFFCFANYDFDEHCQYL